MLFVLKGYPHSSVINSCLGLLGVILVSPPPPHLNRSLLYKEGICCWICWDVLYHPDTIWSDSILIHGYTYGISPRDRSSNLDCYLPTFSTLSLPSSLSFLLSLLFPSMILKHLLFLFFYFHFCNRMKKWSHYNNKVHKYSWSLPCLLPSYFLPTILHFLSYLFRTFPFGPKD